MSDGFAARLENAAEAMPQIAKIEELTFEKAMRALSLLPVPKLNMDEVRKSLGLPTVIRSRPQRGLRSVRIDWEPRA